MTIAYDNVPTSLQPVRWNMQRILLFASLMGLVSVVETFALLIVGLRWVADARLQDMLRLDLAQLQTVLFLQLAVGGHLLLFVVRTKRSLFQARPIERKAVLGDRGDPDCRDGDLLARHRGSGYPACCDSSGCGSTA